MSQPPKENQKLQKQVCFSERGNISLQKEYENGDNDNNQNIYASIAQLPKNRFCHHPNNPTDLNLQLQPNLLQFEQW